MLETGDGPGTLAVRRAMLTIGLDLAECCDDSYGALGDVIGEALDAYASTDWRSAGLPSRVFCEVAAGLHTDYVAARMTWHADEVRVLYGHANVTAGALDRFETTALRDHRPERRRWPSSSTSR